MNLGPWKYRHILSSDGGPIRNIDVLKLDSPILQTVYEAYAELDPAVLSSALVKDLKIYGTADGSGTSLYQNLARYKSISEALERWAFYETADFKRSDHYGFSVDRSTTGMAAFPGLTSSEARENAYYEAVERWSLCAWWEGKLGASLLPLSQKTASPWSGLEIRIEHLLPQLPVDKRYPASAVILWSEISGNDRVCYGFSCSSTLEKAIQRASVELDRNRRVLSELSGTDEISEIGEKRLLYFSSSDGHARFMKQVEQSLQPSSVIAKAPTLVTNGPIKGPWSRYCHVWRCLFEPVSPDHLSDRIDYFLF